MKRPALQNKQVVLLRMTFRARKVFGTLKKRNDVSLNQKCFMQHVVWFLISLSLFMLGRSMGKKEKKGKIVFQFALAYLFSCLICKIIKC